jgi:hypothetical protein
VSQNARHALRHGATIALAAIVLNGCIQLPARQSATTANPTANAAIPQPPLRYNGYGFDACTAPTTTTMGVWRATTSYQAIGVYIGGRARGCTQPQLNAPWVVTVKSQGWRLLPLYVGYQAPCVAPSAMIPPSKLMSTNATTSTFQGIGEAIDAANMADLLGIGTGSPIYYDMEAYGRDGTCIAAVQAFVNGWVAELHARGYRAGFYSSLASGITDQIQALLFSPGYNVPDTIWFARWDNLANVTDGSNPQYLPDTFLFWANHQRHKQYRGGHDETHGLITINIDNDFSDGPAVGYGSRSQYTPPPKHR